MSRHKLVKNLDLDDELYDYDGGEEYDEEGEGTEELSAYDLEQLRLGTIQIREILPKDSVPVSDKQIHDSLYYNYYDIDKTVEYLIKLVTPKTPKITKAEKKKSSGGYSVFFTAIEEGLGSFEAGKLGDHFSYADFFKDTPWLSVPKERLAVMIPPLYPRGGLLGGSGDAAPKMSKLQALAAARKKKAQEQKSDASLEVEKPMENLSLGDSTSGGTSLGPPKQRGFPVRKRKDSNPHEKLEKPQAVINEPEAEDLFQLPPPDQAHPSAFASTMFGDPEPAPIRQPAVLFTLPSLVAISAALTDPFAGPSPDDIVIAAQSKAASKVKGAPRTNGEKRADQIAHGVEAMKMDDTPKPKSKNLDVLAEHGKKEAKNAANFVVIGHVDAGKSTLMGRLLCDLNVIDQRTIDRYRKEAEKIGKSSFAFAWVLDQGTEERNRGVTIDIAMNKFETEKTAFTILDAPGHRDFIPNMIAGAAQADFAVLVIDASTGSFESGLVGQTKEHALLVRSMGVQRLIVAVNKLDTVSWSYDRFTEIKNQVSGFLSGAGFQSKNVIFIPCSGLLGDNIASRSTAADAKWYQGPTLVEELDNSDPVARALDKPLRLTIGDIFRGSVQNPISISGRIEAGSLQVGDALLAQPAGEKCFIKGIEHDSEPVDWAVAGSNVTVHLSDIDPIHLKIGDVLCKPGSDRIECVKDFTVKILAFEFLMPMSVEVLRGRLNVAGRIETVEELLDKGSGKRLGKKKVRIVRPGQVARVRVGLEGRAPLEKGMKVVLRSNGETVGAGLIE